MGGDNSNPIVAVINPVGIRPLIPPQWPGDAARISTWIS